MRRGLRVGVIGEGGQTREGLVATSRAAGARVGEIEPSLVQSVVIAADERAVARRFAAERGWEGTGAEEVRAMPSFFVGTIGRIAETMVARRERYGFSSSVVADAALAAFAPVVAALAGN